MEKTALLVIDVQMAMFLCNGGVFRGSDVLMGITDLLRMARESSTPVIFVQHCGENDEYVAGTATWELAPELERMDSEPVVFKRRWDSFYETELDGMLKSLGVKNLIVCGMQTEFCLDTTLRSAFFHGYECFVVRDTHTTFDTPILPARKIIEHHESIWDGRFAELIDFERASYMMRENTTT